MSPLSDSYKLEVRDYLQSQVQWWLRLIGITNFVAFAGAVVALYSAMPGIINSRMNQLEGDLSAKFNDLRENYGRLKSQNELLVKSNEELGKSNGELGKSNEHLHDVLNQLEVKLGKQAEQAAEVEKALDAVQAGEPTKVGELLVLIKKEGLQAIVSQLPKVAKSIATIDSRIQTLGRLPRIEEVDADVGVKRGTEVIDYYGQLPPDTVAVLASVQEKDFIGDARPETVNVAYSPSDHQARVSYKPNFDWYRMQIRLLRIYKVP